MDEERLAKKIDMPDERKSTNGMGGQCENNVRCRRDINETRKTVCV